MVLEIEYKGVKAIIDLNQYPYRIEIGDLMFFRGKLKEAIKEIKLRIDNK